MATPESESFVRSFARGLKVIEVMGKASAPQTLADIAQAAQLPRTAARRFLTTLTELDFVRTDDRRYWLTPKVLRLGMSYLYTLPYWRHAQLALEALCAEVGQSCAISVLDDEEIVYVARLHARRILAMSPVLGSRLPAHAVSMGRMLLAGLSQPELQAYLTSVRLRRLTGKTIVDRKVLGQQIRLARANGYAWVDRELDDSICGIAVPIRDGDGRTVAAINISLPAGQFTEESACQEFLGPLRETAARIRGVLA
jgi:IclR family transcriptional regulator, pca regulon regulatory protein